MAISSGANEFEDLSDLETLIFSPGGAALREARIWRWSSTVKWCRSEMRHPLWELDREFVHIYNRNCEADASCAAIIKTLSGSLPLTLGASQISRVMT